MKKAFMDSSRRKFFGPLKVSFSTQPQFVAIKQMFVGLRATLTIICGANKQIVNAMVFTVNH